MFSHISPKTFMLGSALASTVLLTSGATFANNITILNKNFESDFIPVATGYTTSISGWVNSGAGNIRVQVPESNGIQYESIGDQAQVAVLDAGGRISQATKIPLVENETYTLKFDSGWRNDQLGQHVVGRLKANGLVLAQLHSDDFSKSKGNWSTETFSFTADSTMPLGKLVVVEFQNLALIPDFQANIDNVHLSIAGTGVTKLPQASLGSITLINTDTTLKVPETYSDINAALASLNDKRIQPGYKVTIKVSDCSNQTYTQPIDIYHPNANKIHIIGNVDLPSACVLQFNGTSGIVANNGNQLGKIDGFTIKGDLSPGTTGLHAILSSMITTGESITVSSFARGIVAEHDATIIANNVTSENNIDIGVYSYSGGYIAANSAVSSGNLAGFVAEGASIIEANNAEALNNIENGFASLYNSTLRASNSTSKSNQKDGFYSRGMSTIVAAGSAATDNTNNGYHATSMSFQDIQDSTNSGNGVSHSPAINTSSGNFRSVLKK